jgi:predicted nucleic acid-binding protein
LKTASGWHRTRISRLRSWRETLRTPRKQNGFSRPACTPGESEAIVLAAELASEALLMDDSDGVKFAAAAGANVIRTPGIYRLAKERGFVRAVRPKLDNLRKAAFWLRDEHYRMILENAGE